MASPFIPKRGIPTLHRGRRYRSRLEARWAVFFDLVGWAYEYEPFDLDGWIPDFSLRCTPERTFKVDQDTGMPFRDEEGELISTYGPSQILVEIKPTWSLDDFPLDKIDRALRGTPLWGTEVLLLGNGVFIPQDDEAWGDSPAVGWLADIAVDPNTNFHKEVYWYETAPFNYSLGKLDFFHSMASYRDRIHGFYDGPRKEFPSWASIQNLWNQAGNTVQWKAPR